MDYDFGCGQLFSIVITDISVMPRGSGRAYPKVLSGAGRGIIDDMSAEELLEIIHDINIHGSSTFCYDAKQSEVAWDYRKYDIDIDNMLLKGEIARIADGYSAFEAYLDN